MSQTNFYEDNKKIIHTVGGLGLMAGATALLFSRYKTSRSHEWLVRTGLMVNDIQIGKKFFQFPFQNIDRINMSPSSFKFSVNAMSKEKMEFNFPAVFTIGPKNDIESLTKFSRYLLNQDNEETNGLIRGIIEGETRSLAANQAIEDIFAARGAFKDDIVKSVQTQLDQYGLDIYNANVEELRDSDTSNYFKSLSQRIKAEAENLAKVQVAEQNKIGNVGSKEREGETRQQVATIEASAALVENSRQQDIIKSSAELEKIRAEQDLIIAQAKIRAEQEALSLKMTLERDVESKRLEMETERQRAEELSKARVQAEKSIKEAQGDADSRKIRAEAELFAKQKEAEGIQALYEAQARGLEQVVRAFGGDSRALLSYTMLEKGIYEKLAQSNAEAIRGLNPKITVWTDNPANSMDTISKLGKTLIPMMDTIQEQTGYALPDWAIKKPNEKA
jgi:flotillin